MPPEMTVNPTRLKALFRESLRYQGLTVPFLVSPSASISRGSGGLRSEPWVPSTEYFLQFIVQNLRPNL
jgi:hypothetical protein